MTQIEIIDQFLIDLRASLDDINELYYGLHYWHSATYILPDVRIQFLALRKYLERYHERVFCYELYHKMRLRMDTCLDDRERNIYSSQNIFLQSELRKDIIHRYIERIFNVIRLSKEFMPDFLLHTPGNFENQLLVMEVKSNPHVLFKDVKYDLLKIQEFITNYQYLQGVFLATNISNRDSKQLLKNIRNWSIQNITTPERIRIMLKSSPDDLTFEITLDDLIHNRNE